MKLKASLTVALLVASLSTVGCKSKTEDVGGGGGNAVDPASTPAGDSSTGGAAPVFSLAWSEYPSWSVFGVAHEMDLVNAEEGEMGTIEKQYNVDIVLKEAGYDSCLNMFTSGNCDAVCMTNMDALIVSPGRDGVAVLPTSTSNGADACIVAGVESVDDLKNVETFGLKGTVSEYGFVRCLETLGKDPAEFTFTNQDPAAAAVAMTQKQETHKSIMVWNPFVLQTLNDRPDAKVLFDSSSIPGEIVDMVVVGRDVLEKDGGDKFVQAVIATFYQMNEELAKPETGDEVLVELGKKFSNLGLDDMKKVVEQTKFYADAEAGLALLTGEEFKTTMTTVEKFCVDQKLVEDPQYGFGEETGKKLLFSPAHLQTFKESK
ncbi:MAG: hypothetical protein R3C05_04670 [Pirellulaceae bacterium]